MVVTKTLFIVDTEEEAKNLYTSFNGFYVKEKNEIRLLGEDGQMQIFSLKKDKEEKTEEQTEIKENNIDISTYIKKTDFMFEKFVAMGVTIPEEFKNES